MTGSDIKPLLIAAPRRLAWSERGATIENLCLQQIGFGVNQALVSDFVSDVTLCDLHGYK